MHLNKEETKMKHAFLTTAAVALMALGSYAEAQNLKMSHVRPQDATIDVELRAFSEAVSEATGGEVTINLFPASALGDYTTVQERISVGAIDMATQPAATAADRRMQISSFPYLAGNWDQARAVEPNGIKVRVPGIKSFQLTGEALGYIPSPIPFSEAFTAVQTGVVDGV